MPIDQYDPTLPNIFDDLVEDEEEFVQVLITLPSQEKEEDGSTNTSNNVPSE